MTLKQAMVLGAVQGLTEFLPISSSAHLILVPWITDWPDQGLTFDVVLHAGTLMAILSCFWRDFAGILRESFRPSGAGSPERPKGRHLLLFLVLGTLPAAIAGMLAEDWVANELRTAEIIPTTLIFFALLLWLADCRAPLAKGLEKISLADTLWVGTAQAIALIPGTSRAGITITAGLFRGMTRAAAARFSFLLAVPILAAASLEKAPGNQSVGNPRGRGHELWRPAFSRP